MAGTFDFPYHRVRDLYPAGATTQFGKGYEFAARPRGPDQIIFALSFKAMWFFQDPNTMLFKNDVVPKLNVLSLVQFYETVRMYDTFTYPHPFRGNVICRFSKPLQTPALADKPGEIGGVSGYRAHQADPFEIELKLQP